MAAAAARLGREEWRRSAARLAGGEPSPTVAEPPTYRELAGTGVVLVERLAAQGRWTEAAEQAGHLTRYFAGVRWELHPVAAQSFDGLQAAARARDRDELADFADLLRELFG